MPLARDKARLSLTALIGGSHVAHRARRLVRLGLRLSAGAGSLLLARRHRTGGGSVSAVGERGFAQQRCAARPAVVTTTKHLKEARDEMKRILVATDGSEP